MKILYYFRELNTPMYHWQRVHWIDELTRMGHKISTFNPLNYSSYDEANEQILQRIKGNSDYDLFITSDDQTVIYPETFEEIRKRGIPTCLICWDNLELPYKQKKIATKCDVVWITSEETQYLFETWGCKNIIFQTYAANPNYFHPTIGRHNPSVCFIGSPYGSRTNKLNDLLAGNIDCYVYSDSCFNVGYNTSLGKVKSFDFKDVAIKAIRYMRFPIGRKVLFSTIKNKFIQKKVLSMNSDFLHLHHSLDDMGMMSVYSQMALSLNITELRDTYILKVPIHKIHLRTFEIPMCGGLQFANYTEELASYFEEDKEIVLYRTKDEMLDKAKYYLSKKRYSKIQRMKEAAHKRAVCEHTWARRFNAVFKRL